MYFMFEHSVSEFIKAGQSLPVPLLILLAFGGGFVASLTPCVLPMIPLYLSYIGAAQVASKVDAVRKALFFCLGAATVFSLMGIFASFASFVMVEYRGYINIVVGIFILLMCLFMLEVVKLPSLQIVKSIPEGSPFIIGVAFSLVGSPCASPIMFSVLAISTTLGSAIGSALVMISYSIGYTGIIFLTAMFAGFLKQFDFFKKNSRVVSVVSSIVLAILGIFYLYSGIRWFTG